MEKIKLNNQIVLMRKYVKQAKVHVINKLAKQVKLLQNRKGSEAQVQKAKRKAERFLEEITLLKKTKPDDVSKLALSKAKNWEDVLKQKNCALYDRCIAMLANYGAVQKQVEIFYNENKELVLKITDLIKQWEEKNKDFHGAKKLSGANKIKLESKPRPLNKNLSTDTQTHSNADGEKNLPSSKTTEELKENKQSNKSQKLIRNNRKNVSDELTETFTDDSSKTGKLNKKSSGNEDEQRSIMKTSHSKDSMDTAVETSESDGDADNEEKMFIKNTIIDKSKTMVGKVQFDESEENSMDAEESESDNEEEFGNNNSAIDNSDDESNCNNNVESKRSASKDTDTTQKYDVSEFIKKKLEMASSSERKLKAITLLNLDEMQGLTEIPVSTKNESGESDEEGSSEDETNDTSHNKKSDPFFLGRGGDDDFTPEEKSDNADGDKNFKTRNKDPFFSNTRSDRGTGNFLQKQEGSDQELSHSRKFQNTGFVKKDFKRLKKDNSSTSPIKNKFLAKNPSKYQEKWKNNLDKDNFRNRKDLKMYPKRTNDKTFEKKSHGWNSKNTESITAKNKVPYKKDNTSNKPLHPSWEAKKKQKELINTSFQGKRMVFDD